MAFCTFSKDYENSYTLVDNKFITKYMPEADGFAVKVYLYGLLLCENADSDFNVLSMAEVLRCTEEQIVEAFAFWEDYDLVQILSKTPFTVQYLPVRSTVGKPKRVRYEQYADFNKELQRKLQKVGKFISANEYIKYMRFLEENDIQPQAFLLIAEYCVNKQGEGFTPSYVFNKAKKLIRSGCTTYEQVEKALSNYNKNERDLIAVFNALSIYGRSPDDGDYALYTKWTETLGFSKTAILAAAKKLKRGSLSGLDLTMDDLAAKGKTDETDVESYLTDRENLANLTFRLGRKLGVKVQNPAPYIDEYVEKWYAFGFEENSLLDVALYCLKTERNNFDCMHEVVGGLYKDGVVSADGVKAFLKEKNAELKLFAKIQEICGGIRKSQTNLSMISTWKSWKFNDEMILEAARRSAASASPVPYMNRILSEWKQGGVYALNAIPAQNSGANSRMFVNPAVQDINAKADRERYYALLREKALARADKTVEKANANARFKAITKELSKLEIALAKAEVFGAENLPDLERQKFDLLAERKTILNGLGINEEELLPQFVCKKCSDTGFLPSGKACNCYNPQS